MTPGEGRGSVRGFEEVGTNQLACDGKCTLSFAFIAVFETSLPRFSLILDRLLGFLPPRFAATYSQVRPRLVQREHVGFS
jgi:hypothetical protein